MHKGLERGAARTLFWKESGIGHLALPVPRARMEISADALGVRFAPNEVIMGQPLNPVNHRLSTQLPPIGRSKVS